MKRNIPLSKRIIKRLKMFKARKHSSRMPTARLHTDLHLLQWLPPDADPEEGLRFDVQVSQGYPTWPYAWYPTIHVTHPMMQLMLPT